MSNLDILNKHNFKFNKAYGQNFIFDKNFLRSIIDHIDENSDVLEIGPGAGTLTSILCEKVKEFSSIPFDHNTLRSSGSPLGEPFVCSAM